jgi:hypothetical protein
VSALATQVSSSPRWLWLCAALVSAAVVFIRLRLGFAFPVPWNDETAFLAQAFAFKETNSLFVWGLNAERDVMWMPPGYFVLMGTAFKLLGYSFGLARSLSAVSYLVGFAILLQLAWRHGRKQWRAVVALALGIAFLSPYSLAIANLARMEALFDAVILLSLLAACRQQPVIGLALVFSAALVHFNASYFLLPYAGWLLWLLLRRQTLQVTPPALLCLLAALALWALYVRYLLHDLDGFVHDMRFQFAIKSIVPPFKGRSGQLEIVALLLIPVLLSWAIAQREDQTQREAATHRSQLPVAVWLALYGVSFVMLALNGHMTWYFYGFNFGFALLILALATDWHEPTIAWRAVCATLAIACLAALGHYGTREHKTFTPQLANVTRTGETILSDRDHQRIARFIRQLTPAHSVSFGFTGIEPFFFDDFAASGARWTISSNDVTRWLPTRNYDYRIRCNSPLWPAYAFKYDWDGYPRNNRTTGCDIIDVATRKPVPKALTP